MKKIWSKRHSLRLGENWSFGPLHFEKIFGVKFPNQFIGYKDEFGYGFIDDSMLQVCFKHVISEIYKLGFEKYFEKRALPIFESFLDYSKNLSLLVTESVSNQELHKLWNAFVEKEDEWMNYVWMVFLLDEGLTNEIKKRLNEINFSDTDRLLPAMVAPAKKTAAYNLKVALMTLALKAQKGENINKDLEQIRDSYSYFSILNMDETPLDISYFKTEIDKLNEKDISEDLNKLTVDETDMQTLYQEVKNKLVSYPDILRLIEACKKVAYYREYRNDLRQESYYYARHLYIELAKRSGIKINDFIFATRKEIENFLLLGDKLPKEGLVQRKSLAAIVSNYDENNIKYIFDKDQILKLWPEENIDMNVKEFKGISAFKGNIKGKVKIIFDVNKQADDFKDGNILVATTTNLAFIPLMSKAAAIVTDEGGLLTHTAIVARELKKVAIVGSKVATKVLKDGDLVEVDADNGTVKILK